MGLMYVHIWPLPVFMQSDALHNTYSPYRYHCFITLCNMKPQALNTLCSLRSQGDAKKFIWQNNESWLY